MKLVIASRNKKKTIEMRQLLCSIPGIGYGVDSDVRSCVGVGAGTGIDSDIEVLSLDDIGFFDEIVEDGNSFHENAKIKAKTGSAGKYICVADDSGLVVDALGGAPGIYSARYAGEGADDERNNQKLLRELSNIPFERRTARFVCSICCVFPDGSEINAEESCEGKILFEPVGNNGFGYDPLFYAQDCNKSFAELDGETKNAISHRGRAMRKFALAFSEALKNNDSQIK